VIIDGLEFKIYRGLILAMPDDDRHSTRAADRVGAAEDEGRALLSTPNDEDIIADSVPTNNGTHSPALPKALNGQRRPPRTPLRVRFDLGDAFENGRSPTDGPESPSEDLSWIDEDYIPDEGHQNRSRTGQTVPLLTNIEAPSVTVATSDSFCPEDHLENARPRSGLRMAFMNMANSIIGAGIIGQAYAFRQAGLATGILLLIVLTITVDWTIRLIVVNSKLSGADSFQATMQHCFGKSGLIAISVAQWAFAFGGMVAFCIIVGDSIPHVFNALFPSLREKPFLWLLTDRRAIIVIFILGVSYPLSLYRDIAKVFYSYTTGDQDANRISWRKLRHWRC